MYDPRRRQGVTKVRKTVLRDFLFDCAINASYEQEMHLSLIVYTKKTEVMLQSAPRNQYQKPQISVNGQTLQAVKTFTYLGKYTLLKC